MTRRVATIITGILAVVGLDVAFNALLIKENPFTPWVAWPLVVAAVFALVWALLSLGRLARTADRGKTSMAFHAVAASVAVLGICIVLFAFARHSKASWDLTREGRRQLSEQTIKILESLQDDVTVYGLFITDASTDTQVAKDKTRRFLERCQEYTSKLHVRFVDPEKNAMILKELELSRVSPKGTVVVESGPLKRTITLSGANARLEEWDFANALIFVSGNRHPKVYFLAGVGGGDINSQDPDGFSILKMLLERESYKVDSLTISPVNPHIPLDCDVLVICGYQRDLRPYEMAAIDSYINTGGRMLVLLELQYTRPGTETIQEIFRPWLKDRLGVLISEDSVYSMLTKWNLQLSPDFGPMAGDSPYRGSFNDQHPVTRGFKERLLFVGARSVKVAPELPKGVTCEVIVRSDPQCRTVSLRKEGPRRQMSDLGSVPLAVAVTVNTDVPVADSGKTRDARVIVVGNQSFANNEGIKINGNLVMNMFAWLTAREELIGIRPTGQEDKPLVLSDVQQKVIAWIASLGMLHVLALAGITAYLLRRKYQ